MAGLSDLFGRSAYLEQLLLWGTLSQVLGAAMGPALQLLSQDANRAHPVTPIDPGTLADLAARSIITVTTGEQQAALSGLDAARFGDLVALHTVRLAPADLATLVLRTYMSPETAAEQARPQGVSAQQLAALTYLAGDALGPEQLAQAARRKLIPHTGTGPGSVSYQQGIAESRLHDKWGQVLYDLSAVLLSPADAASAVVRNFLSLDEATALAARNGVDAGTLGTLIHLSADAPGPQQLAEALRRGAIDATGTGPGSTSFQQGIAEGRLADKWAPVIKALSVIWPTPVDALDAALKGQISAEQGRELYQRLGGDLQFYPWLLASVGDSPTPLEAAAMADRGIIGEHGTGPQALSYDQAVLESRYRNKWGPAYRQLARHIPTPSEVTVWLAHKLIDTEQAHDWLALNGLPADEVTAYIAEAEYEAVSDYRGLTQTAVIDMYTGHVITRDQAVTILGVLHVSERAAGLLLDYADMRYAITSISSSVTRLRTLFAGRKITAATAADSLIKLGIDHSAIDAIIADWEIEAAADVKILSAAEITDAMYYGIMTEAEARQSLEAIGYTPYDAWVVLSVKVKGPLPHPPPRVVGPPPGAVIPGVT